jgi:hypothetical protein
MSWRNSGNSTQVVRRRAFFHVIEEFNTFLRIFSKEQDSVLRGHRPNGAGGPAEFASAFASELLSTGQDEAVWHN